MPSATRKHAPVRLRSLASMGLLALALLTLLAARPAPASAMTGADYAYWFAYAQTRIYPTTAPPAGAPLASNAVPNALALGAAQSEFEGRQISLRPQTSGLRDIWIEPSDLEMDGAPEHIIGAKNVSVFKVWYVDIQRPSYGFKQKGLQPDPLLPMTIANGQRLGWRPGAAPDTSLRAASAGKTQPFYVLFQVPADAAPGSYVGSLKVTAVDDPGAPAAELTIPVALTVYPFSVERRTLQTSFGLNLHDVMTMNSAARQWLLRDPNAGANSTRVPERTDNHSDQSIGYLKFMSDHRVSPQTMSPAWESPDGNGIISARHDLLGDFLGTGAATSFQGNKLNFNTVKMPEYTRPAWLKDPFTSRSATNKATRYYASMKAELGPDASKAYAYPIDEPSASKRKFTEKYAKLIHRAAPGVKVLLTTDPTTQKNKLVKGVDIYVSKLHFVFRDTGWNKKIRKSGKQLWIYSHMTNWSAQTPSYLIDAPPTDSRVQAWMAYRLRANGLLYFNVTNWHKGVGKTGQAPRDPYTDPVTNRKTYKGKALNANGDGTLAYPGYYPPLGLIVEGAPPVSSMRMEALRDGLEDYEYLQQVSAKYGQPTADAYSARIIGALPKAKSGRLAFPPFSRSEYDFEAVRAEMAARLSQ